MDPEHRTILRSNRVKLAKEMDLKNIYPYLIAKDIYKPFMIEDFEIKGSRFDQSNALLSSLETRGPNAFDALCFALENVQPHLAAFLRPPRNDQKTEDFQIPYQNSSGTLVAQPSEENSLQLTVWPDNSKSGSFLSDYPRKSTVECTNPDEVYTMSSNPTGVVFILNNKDFESKATPRKGSDIDKENLRHVFSCLGFKVIIKENRRSKDFFFDLEEMMVNEIKSDHGCIVVILLSYGDKYQIYGSDGKSIPLSRVFSQFNGHFCPEMTGKPKLFFIQSCSNEIPSEKAKVTTDKSAEVKVEGSDKMSDLSQDLSRLEVDATDASQVHVLPTSTDLFCAHSTVPGSWAWDRSERGSWFIEALCEVLLTKSSSDLVSLMTMVNERIKVAVSTSATFSNNRTASLPEVVNMLRKKVYFNVSH